MIHVSGLCINLEMGIDLIYSTTFTSEIIQNQTGTTQPDKQQFYEKPVFYPFGTHCFYYRF